MSRFNLIDEKWIPVRFPDGTARRTGNQGYLAAGEGNRGNRRPLAAGGRVAAPLLAGRSVPRSGRPDRYRRGQSSCSKAGLPGNKITDYLKKWRDRFWLFDAKYPFGQNPLCSAERN